MIKNKEIVHSENIMKDVLGRNNFLTFNLIRTIILLPGLLLWPLMYVHLYKSELKV